MASLMGVFLSIGTGLLGLILIPILAPIVAFIYMLELLIHLYNDSLLFAGSFLVRVVVPATIFLLPSMLLRIFHGAVMLSLSLCLITLAAFTMTFKSIQTLLTTAFRPAPDLPAVLDAPNASSDLPSEWPSDTRPSSSTPSLCSDTTLDSPGIATPHSISSHGSNGDGILDNAATN